MLGRARSGNITHSCCYSLSEHLTLITAGYMDLETMIKEVGRLEVCSATTITNSPNQPTLTHTLLPLDLLALTCGVSQFDAPHQVIHIGLICTTRTSQDYGVLRSIR